ncbi:AAA family ATPase [Natroniella sulfidigena]|uniref:AAA family ATPase n=1 Tax=Natroniella sulfidigena TaxID=723921 RepID=UPI002009ECE2|nr:AAA family ATPase [Natroniella sulfidigena]MCK8817155.1 AAA family ATPase [Natroniella sulfidigena]
MIINSMKLLNFKQYYGEQEVKFSGLGEKNVTIINGKNGAGKTNFFKAINWCLYGENVIDIEGQIVNKNALKEADINSNVEVKVSINFRHRTSSYLMIRRISVKKEAEDSYISQGSSEVEMFEINRGSDSQEKVPDPLIKLNLILPSNVRNYFLFDGEKIDEFARPEHKDEVWNAVRNVLKLEVIERGKKHFKDIAYEYSRELKNYSSGNLKVLLNKEEKYKREKENKLNELNDKKDELKECQRQINEIEKKQSEIKEIKDLIDRRNKIRSEIKRLKNDLKEYKNKLKDNLSKSSIIFGSKILNNMEKFLDNIVKDNKIPSGTLKKLCQKIIKEEICICGRDIERGTNEYRELVDLISKGGEKESNESFLIDLKASLKAVIQKKNDLLKDIREKHNKIRNLQEKIDYFKAQENEISSQLTENERENVSKLEEGRNSLLEDKGKLKEQINILEDKINELSDDIEEIQDEIEKEKSLEKEMEDLKQKKLISEKSSKALEDIYNKFAEEMRLKIEEKSSDIFQKLIRKKQSFSKVILDEDYQLKLVDRFGDEDSRSEISAGERQVLSLAFILGLSKVSEGEAPLVMDTPFGRLDSEHRKNIVDTIPELTSQLVLFVTDEELDENNRAMLQNKIDQEYTLRYNDQTGNTKIVRDL